MGWHLRPLRRLLAMLLPVALAAAIVTTAQPARAATVPWGTVLVPGSAWAGSYASLGDLNVYSNGDGDEDVWGTYGWEYECFELAARWADIAYGDSPFGWDAAYAYQMYATGPYQNPPFLQQPNGGAYLPQFGDLLVFDQTSFDPSGHVAVVTSVGDGYVNIVEQNWGDPDPTGYASLPIGGDVSGVWDPTYMPPRWGLPILGWLESTVLRQGVAGSGGALPSASPAPSGAEPPTQVNPPTPTAMGSPVPTALPSGDPTIGTVGPGISSSGPDPAVPLPPCDCTWGTQFLPTGAVVSGSGSGSHPLPPTPSPTAGASASPWDIPPGISTMPPTNAPQPRIE